MKIGMFANIATGLYIFNFSSGFEDQNVYEIFNLVISFKMAMWKGLPKTNNGKWMQQENKSRKMYQVL